MKFSIVFLAAFVASLTMSFPQWPGSSLKTLLPDKAKTIQEVPNVVETAEDLVEEMPKSALDGVMGDPGSALEKYLPKEVTEIGEPKSWWSKFLQLIFGLFLKLFMPAVPGVDEVPGASAAVGALTG